MDARTNGARDASFSSDVVQEPLRKREKGELVLVALRPRARANYVIMRDRVDGSNEPAASQRSRSMNSDEYITSKPITWHYNSKSAHRMTLCIIIKNIRENAFRRNEIPS